jgi:hypothetical protein
MDTNSKNHSPQISQMSADQKKQKINHKGTRRNTKERPKEFTAKDAKQRKGNQEPEPTKLSIL